MSRNGAMLRLEKSRVGERGSVYDQYALIVEGIKVATIRHYVEYALDETPVEVTPCKHKRLALARLARPSKEA